MKCEEFDWKGYVLNEITAPERRRVEEHLSSCAACCEEVAALRLTMTALQRLPVREVPRRISFVSDPVFEPSWWQRFWSSGPKLGFASAAMLSMAILAHGWVARPAAPAPIPVAQVAPAAAPAVSPDQVRAQVAAELKPVMANLEAKLDSMEKRSEQQRQADLAEVKMAFDAMHKRVNNMSLMAARFGGD